MSAPPSDVLTDVVRSTNYRAVDEALYTAKQLFFQMHGENMPPFVRDAFEATQRSEELALKRAVWLLCATLCQPIAEYAIAHAANPEKAAEFMRWVSNEFELLFTGKYSGFEFSIIEFVSAIQMQFES